MTTRRLTSALALATATVATVSVSGSLAAGATATPASRCGPVSERPWCDTSLSATQRAQLLEAAMTTSDKVEMLTGSAISSLGVPAVEFTDGALGVRGPTLEDDPATAMPAGIALAAGFSRAEAEQYGSVVGSDARELGYDAVDGPTVNMMRTPVGGRTYEAYGEDPYLTASTAVGWIDGLQAEGVMSAVKHFVANDQEGQVGPTQASGAVGGRYVADALVDQRTLHEIYELPFEAAVKQAHAAMVMCSYNQVNTKFSCESPTLLQSTLRQEWGFDGIVISDAGAAHDTVANLNAGLDVDTLGTAYYPELVDAALDSGLVSATTLDDRVFEILRGLFTYGFLDHPTWTASEASIDQASDDQTAQAAEDSGITLLKNTDQILPLDSGRLSSIAVIGSPADSYVYGAGSSQVTPTSESLPLQAIESRAGSHVPVSYDDGSDLATAVEAASKAQVAIVFVRDSESEGTDKACMSLDCPSFGISVNGQESDEQVTLGPQDQLIAAVAAANPNTIVVMETGAPVPTPWRGEVKGVLEAWYPGQEGGAAIAAVLFGDADPGGRLPVTFPASPSQEQVAGNLSRYPGIGELVSYSEGVFVGYRWFQAHDETPAYPFGYGLSYTTFSYHGLRITPGGSGQDTVATVRVEVTNTGSRAGAAVPELYLRLPSLPGTPEPPEQLKGYDSISLAPGQTASVRFPLNDRSFAYWETAAGQWRIARGCFGVAIGSSSATLLLRAEISRLGAACGPGAIRLDAPDHAAGSSVLTNPPGISYGGGGR